MQRPPGTQNPWRRAGIATLMLLALVGLPVELTVAVVEHPVVAPSPVVTVLLVGSCLLLICSGLGLRRLEAARALAHGPAPGA
jgi:hypothetical protein